VADHLADIPKGRAIITYCTCPNEDSAAQVARALEASGFKDVHALHGGFDAWTRAGQPVEPRAGQLTGR
jgi:rhodanese-related sulfurtransferase